MLEASKISVVVNRRCGGQWLKLLQEPHEQLNEGARPLDHSEIHTAAFWVTRLEDAVHQNAPNVQLLFRAKSGQDLSEWLAKRWRPRTLVRKDARHDGRQWARLVDALCGRDWSRGTVKTSDGDRFLRGVEYVLAAQILLDLKYGIYALGGDLALIGLVVEKRRVLPIVDHDVDLFAT